MPSARSCSSAGSTAPGARVQIVGVVNDVRSMQLAKKDEVKFYRPFAQRANTFFAVAIRGSGRPEALLGTARAALDRVDRQLPFIQPSTMEKVVGDSLGQERLTMTLLVSFALIALLLALVGIYGAVAYTVEQRTNEIGVRMALGAQARDVLRLIVSQAMAPVVAGLLVGLVVTLALGRVARLAALPGLGAQPAASELGDFSFRRRRAGRLSHPRAPRHARWIRSLLCAANETHDQNLCLLTFVMLSGCC